MSIPLQQAFPLACAIVRLRRLDPATYSPCAAQAEAALRELGWNMDHHQYAPDVGTPVGCQLYQPGIYLTPNQNQ